MQHQVLGAKVERALNLAAKRGHALLAHVVGLAAHVHQVAGVNHERANVELGAQLAHALGLLGSTLGARHMRGLEEKI
jgi:hypothetical protein